MSKNNEIIIIPPGYEYVGEAINNDPEASLQAVFISSVDGEFLDADNYQSEAPEMEQAELPQAFKDYAPKV
jgi:hypothetical protein|tara:strand:+ start:400 stop:612 length:213 start_codon:yes stop_codon:yes gene_type:complete